jgi:CxxC motif-containing protein (DUF1111 family)
VFQQRVTPALAAAPASTASRCPRRLPPARCARLPTSRVRLARRGTDSAILSYADPDDRNGDGVSGRPNRFVDGSIGRFGRKAFVPALRNFNDGAFLIEMGVTSAAIPVEEQPHGNPLPAGTDPTPEPEIGEQALGLTDFFVRFLAPPAPLRRSAEARRGADAFTTAGCAACHLPRLRTGSEHPALRTAGRGLHGPAAPRHGARSGGRVLSCPPAEFRTEPLMVRLATRFMHDGRASLEQAIELHSGEGAASRDRFRSLSEQDRAAVIAFLKTL